MKILKMADKFGCQEGESCQRTPTCSCSHSIYVPGLLCVSGRWQLSPPPQDVDGKELINDDAIEYQGSSCMPTWTASFAEELQMELDIVHSANFPTSHLMMEEKVIDEAAEDDWV